jgi:hypothetical protein
MLGYEKIPAFWKEPVYLVEDMDLKYTTISLNDIYRIGNGQALQVISRNGGKVKDSDVEIAYQEPKTVKLEVSFENQFPQYRKDILINVGRDQNDYTFNFTGTAFVITGRIETPGGNSDDYVFDLETIVDGKSFEKSKMPVKSKIRKDDIAWAYGLNQGEHTVTVRILNPSKSAHIRFMDYIVYGDKEVTDGWKK